MNNNTNAILNEVYAEVVAASKMYPPMHSAHEGFSVLYEEVDELWDEVKAKQSKRSAENLRKEAIQVAAMAVRFIQDICNGDKHNV